MPQPCGNLVTTLQDCSNLATCIYQHFLQFTYPFIYARVLNPYVCSGPSVCMSSACIWICKLVYSIIGQDYTDNEKSTFSVANEMYTAPAKSHSQVYNVYSHM